MVKKMAESGFCFGVRKAFDKAIQYEDAADKKQVFLFGKLVNNRHVMQKFLDKGFLVSEETNSIPAGSAVIIRAHGVSRAVYDELKNKNVTIEDCTCVKIMKIHEIADEKSSSGYKVIVIGKANHPEVIGTVGWCSSGSAYVVEKEADLSFLDLSGKVCVVAQTTCNKELWEKATAYMLEKNASAEIYNTLCAVTGDREKKAKAIAENSDVMLVIGDNDSSNSRELYEQCRAVCENTFFISSFLDLDGNGKISKIILNSSNIGLAGGASAPDSVMTDVHDYLVFMDLLKNAKSDIEKSSREYLNEFRSNAIKTPFVQDSLGSLCEQNEGGKRIRGAMIKLGEMIASHGKNENYMPIAVGYELFQTAVLIHDDIIDKGDTRRKKVTVHVDSAQKIKNTLAGNITTVNAEHFGVSRALCIGDYGFFISYQFLAKSNINSSILIKVYQLYSQILTTTCEGEIMDTVLPFERISIINNYEEYIRVVNLIYEYKTAWYTLAGPIMLGAVCGSASDDLIDLLKKIMIPLGIAFQIKDDLLGIYSIEGVLGKSVLSDVRENKQTLMFGFAYKNANDSQRELLDLHYGREDAGEYDLDIVRKLFIEIGAKKYAETEIHRLSDCSKELISNSLIDTECQSILLGLISYLIGRKF